MRSLDSNYEKWDCSEQNHHKMSLNSRLLYCAMSRKQAGYKEEKLFLSLRRHFFILYETKEEPNH